MDVVIEVHPGVDITATGLKEVDPVKMMKASPPGTRSQVVTCRAPIDSEFDFLKRVFMYGSEGALRCVAFPSPSLPPPSFPLSLPLSLKV